MQRAELTFFEFQQLFPDEESCREHLFQMRWPNGFECPKCGHTKYYEIKTRHLYECKDCNYQSSVTANTIFHRTRTPLQIWFWAIFLVASDKRGISALALSKEFPITYPTAWSMLHKIRKAMQDRDQKYQLEGIIELDEAYFGTPTKDKKRGRGTQRSKVLVSVSVDDAGNPQFAKMDIIDDLSQDTLHKKITKNIKPNSALQTDGFRSYLGLENFQHERYISNKMDLNVTDILSSVHKLIGNVKAFVLGTYHGLGSKHLQNYLDEYCYRFNRRFWQPQLFERLCTACINMRPVTYAELTL